VSVLRGESGRHHIDRCWRIRGAAHTRLQIMTENCKPASHLNLIALFSAFSIEDADFDAFVVREVDHFVPGLVAAAICPVHVDGHDVSGLVEVDVEV